MDIVKIIAVFILLALMALVIKSFSREYGIAFSVAVSVISLGLIVLQITPLVNEITELTQQAGINTGYMKIMVKALGICYITDFAVESCREAGEISMAAKASLCGKIAMAALAIPLIKDVLELSVSIL